MFCDDRSPSPVINEDGGPQILEEEVQKALRKIWGKGKAAMLATLCEFGIKEITKLLNIIHDTGEISTYLKKSVYIAIPKKISTVECDQHRTISFMSQLSKVMLRVLMNRMRNKILPEISETQYGFMTDKGIKMPYFPRKP